MVNPPINELNQALNAPLPLGASISNDIYNIFVREEDQLLTPHAANAAAFNRFFIAQQLYQKVLVNGAAEAVFYRIDDRTALEARYQHFRREIRQEFLNSVNNVLKAAPTAIEIRQFFNNAIQTLQVIHPRSVDQNIKLEVANYLLNSPNQPQLQTNINANIRDWFTDRTNDVKNLASLRFYGVNDVTQAYNVGTIYGPGANHSWGVNAGWALAVTLARLPIRIISELDIRNANRSHPNSNHALNPSAFALEISIAIKMGYGLNISNGASIYGLLTSLIII